MKAKNKLQQALGVLEGGFGDITELQPAVQKYTYCMQHDMAERPYFEFPGIMSDWFEELENQYEGEAFQVIHEIAMITLMCKSLDKLLNASRDDTLPPSVMEAVDQWFCFLSEQIAEGTYPLDVEGDLFKKDISICALNMWPSNTICHYEQRALPRSFLLTNGGRQLVEGLKMIGGALRFNYKNMYELHMEDRRTTPDFLEPGWRRFYLDMAERLKYEPQISGIFAQGWFWDPFVMQQSPRITYLRCLPEEGGALFFKLGECNDPDHVALKNKRRLQLFEQGKYEPTNYLMVWPRDDLLNWASKQTAETIH
ncbi:hypothetical protein [Flexibacterium corallicola]|uniref:hypothetical protein n=1 Tax=Flexibacterium corallicola TaxID=3037259 RepID=UPI00286EF59E|nr:hypothetical protein [Pseudovibrio sp. M1P-2-3]